MHIRLIILVYWVILLLLYHIRVDEPGRITVTWVHHWLQVLSACTIHTGELERIPILRTLRSHLLSYLYLGRFRHILLLETRIIPLLLRRHRVLLVDYHWLLSTVVLINLLVLLIFVLVLFVNIRNVLLLLLDVRVHIFLL
jgi:hypothetical protein